MNVALGTKQYAIFYYHFGTGENSYFTPTDQYAWPNETTLLLQSASSMALSAIDD